MHLPKSLRSVSLTAMLAVAPLIGFAQPVVIVSHASPINEMRASDLADIFLGRRDRLPGTGRLTPVDAPAAAPEREAFYLKYAGRNPAQMRAYWSRLLFTGKAYPPAEASSEAAMKRMVAANPAFIGYIDAAVLDPSVKPVRIRE